MQKRVMKKLMLAIIHELTTEDGINASSKSEIYGCFFGRDSEITVLKILKVLEKEDNPTLRETAKKTLLTLTKLQGQAKNIHTGEEAGKFIHEFRKEKYEHLVSLTPPWFVQKDNTIKNYDSIDSTPLALIAINRYYNLTKDEAFLAQTLKPVRRGLDWLLKSLAKDNLLRYSFSPRRKYGGLKVQSWTDSTESMIQSDGSFPKYPIAPVEAQAYTWLALLLWADYFEKYDLQYALKLREQAQKTKEEFNTSFLIEDEFLPYFAQALDGKNNKIKTITANPLLALWTGYKKDGQYLSIIDEKYLKPMVARAFMPDMFVKDAGIRTMSSKSKTYNPKRDSYHNGSFWPYLNGVIHEGLMNFGFTKEAALLKKATLKPIKHFKNPVEVYVRSDEGYELYENQSGQTSTQKQAWSAAALLDLAYS